MSRLVLTDIPGPLHVLWFGGAYSNRPAVPADEAKRLGEAAAQALLDQRYDEAIVYHRNADKNDAWSGWLWASLWVILDYSTSRIWIIGAADVD